MQNRLTTQQLYNLIDIIYDNVSLIVSGALYQNGDDSFCDVDATQDIVNICVTICHNGQFAEEILKIAEQVTDFSKSESLKQLLDWRVIGPVIVEMLSQSQSCVQSILHVIQAMIRYGINDTEVCEVLSVICSKIMSINPNMWNGTSYYFLLI